MNANELRNLLLKTERLNEKRKRKRFAYTTLFYAAVLFVIFWLQGQLEGADIWGILGDAVVCIVLSIPCVLFNSIVFGQLTKASQNEETAIEFLKKQIEKKEREERLK